MPTNFTLQQRQALLASLKKGRQNAISAKLLAKNLGYPLGNNEVQLRGLIKKCIEVDGDLIGSSTRHPQGFFIVDDIKELETYLDNLESRTKSNNSRRTALINSWNNQPNIPKTSKPILIIQ